jgi:hypothetical protein
VPCRALGLPDDAAPGLGHLALDDGVLLVEILAHLREAPHEVVQPASGGLPRAALGGLEQPQRRQQLVSQR